MGSVRVEAEGRPRDARRRRRGGARGLFLWPDTVGAIIGISDPSRGRKTMCEAKEPPPLLLVFFSGIGRRWVFLLFPPMKS
jgi:hypothetical protein